MSRYQQRNSTLGRERERRHVFSLIDILLRDEWRNANIANHIVDVSFLCNRGRKLLFTIFHCNAIVYNICSNDSIYLSIFHNSVYLEMFLLTSAAPPVTSLGTSPPRPAAEWAPAAASQTTAPGCCCCCCCGRGCGCGWGRWAAGGRPRRRGT